MKAKPKLNTCGTKELGRAARPQLTWRLQPCAGCGAPHKVQLEEAHWRKLCAVCYKARNAKQAQRDPRLITCANCGADYNREVGAVGKLCYRCYGNKAIADIQVASRRSGIPLADHFGGVRP